MKTLKKALSIILGVAMILSCVAGMQISASAEGTLALSVGEATVADGVATVPVVVDTNSGFQSLAVTVSYDNTVLTLVEGVKNDKFSTAADSAVVGPTDANPFKMMWAYALTTENVTATGTIATLTFNVVEGATAADIDIEVTEAWDVAGDEVAATAEDGTVDLVKECAHNWGTGVVTTQPTKDAEGVRTFTCALCSETKTEAIAKPVSLNSESSILNHALYLSEVVGDQIGVNRTVNANGVINRGYSDYFLEVSYMKYGEGFTLVEDVKTFYPADKAANSTTKVDYFVYKNIALSEMAKEYTCTLYCLDAEGVVVAYQENVSSISSQALSYVKKYSTNTELVTACVDMMNYGKALQEYFTVLNPGSAIDGAKFPTVGFEDYADYASDASLVPELVNTTATKNKLVETTQLLAGNGTLEIASSNLIRATFRCGTYDPNLVTIVASYTSKSGAEIVSEEVTLASVPVSGTTYSYTFDKLSVYDVNEYVTFTLKYNNVPEYTFTYSIDSFVNTNIGNAKYSTVLTNLELFSRAMRVYKDFE